MDPQGLVEIGDFARILFRKDFLGGKELLELEVLEGEQPGLRIRVRN